MEIEYKVKRKSFVVNNQMAAVIQSYLIIMIYCPTTK